MELVWHMARAARSDPPNTLVGLDAALAAGATRIEVDVRLLADTDAVLTHDRTLADGRSVLDLSRADATSRGLPTLSEAVRRMGASPAERTVDLQVDLKDERLLAAEEVRRLLELVAPLGDRVVIGSMMDWNLRTLRAASPTVRLGFDPLLYFHHWQARPDEVPFPRQQGIHGYWDDHFLATVPLMPARDYVAVRLEALQGTIPRLDEIMVHYPTLLRAMLDGVDAVRLFHERGTKVVAWTLDADAEHGPVLFAQFAAAGVDVLVTNTPQSFGA